MLGCYKDHMVLPMVHGHSSGPWSIDGYMIYKSDGFQIHSYIFDKHNIQEFSNLGYIPQ